MDKGVKDNGNKTGKAVLEKNYSDALKLMRELSESAEKFLNDERGGEFRPGYHGYPRSFKDLCVSFPSLPKALQIESGEATASGYKFSYNVLNKHKDNIGREVIDSFIICAWPEKLGLTGDRVLIAGNSGKVYSRQASVTDKYSYPISGIPEPIELNDPEEWRRE